MIEVLALRTLRRVATGSSVTRKIGKRLPYGQTGRVVAQDRVGEGDSHTVRGLPSHGCLDVMGQHRASSCSLRFTLNDDVIS